MSLKEADDGSAAVSAPEPILDEAFGGDLSTKRLHPESAPELKLARVCATACWLEGAWVQ